MKLTALLLVLNVAQILAGEAYSQKAKVNINVTNSTIGEVLDKIEKQTSYLFFYNKKEINVDKKVNLYASNESVANILNSIFNEADVSYAMVKDYIVLTPKNSLIDVATALQQKTIAGTVTDASTGESLPGVSVSIAGKTAGTITDGMGKYTLVVSNQDSVLVFSYVGYLSERISIGEKTNIDVKLAQDIKKLEEVVVVGYGSVKKKDLTGAVSVVNVNSLQKQTGTTIADAMQGLTSGVYIRGGSQAGAEATIEIRGAKSLGASSTPLYIVDGLPTNGGRDINPDDIASIQILKDASAAAIYGVRASNGVIIITTKKGKEGPAKIDLSIKKTYQVLPRYDLMSTDEFAYWNNMAYDNAGVPRENLNMSVNTDWQNAAFRTGAIDDVNFGISGGNKTGNYYVGAGYFGNKGDIIGTSFYRYSVRINTEVNKGILKIGENMQANTGNQDEMSGSPIIDVVRMLPTIPVYDPNNPGGYGYGNEATARTFGTNPVAHTDFEHTVSDNFRVRGTLWGELTLFKVFKYKLNLGYETSSDHARYLLKPGDWTLNQPLHNSKLNENRARYINKLVENTLTFDKTIGKHSINALIGQSFSDETYAMIWGEKQNITQNSSGAYYTVLDDGTSNLNTGGYENRGTFLSYFGRVNYSFGDKYLFSGILRKDGTSRVAEKNHWGYFPSISAAWRISKEDFFKNKISWINDLKLRASYGEVGAMNIGYWDYLGTINLFPQAVFGTNQHLEPGATNVKLANHNLKWETSAQTNFGIDAQIFDKFSVSAEYFVAKNRNILYGMPIPMYTGNDGGNPAVNSASTQNKGVEITGAYRNEDKAFKYNIVVNFSTLRNKVLSLGGYGDNPTILANTITNVGLPIGEWYLIKSDGIFTSQEQVDNYKDKNGNLIQPNAKPGDIKFIDYNGDGRITSNDRQNCGSPWPKFEGGLTFNASYKNFDFSMTWFGSYGAKVFDALRTITDGMSDNSNYRKGLKPYIDNSHPYNAPRPYYGTTDNSRYDIDRWLEDGSFARLKLISLGYTVPSKLLSKTGFESCRVSISGQNLLTITKYQGLDPEFPPAGPYQKGLDPMVVPNAKMYSVALQLKF